MIFRKQRLLACSGFTLLEILVAISILGVIVGAVFSVFSIGLGSYKKGIAKGDIAQEVTGGLALIENDIQHMLPPTSGDEVFMSETMKFIASTDTDDRQLQMINYEILDDKLFRKFLTYPFQNTYSDPVAIIRGIEEAKFEYLYKDKWEREQKSGGNYPDGMRISLKLLISKEDGVFRTAFFFPVAKKIEEKKKKNKIKE